MERKRVFVMGIDGLDPAFLKVCIEEGLMPNTEKLLKRASGNLDYAMIGGHPTVTPPMWTTLACGCSPRVHGITGFNNPGPELGDNVYAMDSRLCKAEQMWNVTAEAGLKTLVWHWPGAAWPPSSDNPNLMVVDGTQPEGVNNGNAVVDSDKVLVASVNTPELLFRRKAATDTKVPCYIEGMEFEEDKQSGLGMMFSSKFGGVTFIGNSAQLDVTNTPLDAIYSPIKEAAGWADAPEDAKECTILNSEGLIHRPCLILKNEEGIYDRVAIYKNKKATEPIAVCKVGEYVTDIVDEVIYKDNHVMSNRNAKLLEIAPDGTMLKMWFSNAQDFSNDTLWYPKTLLKEIVDNVGYPKPCCICGGHDERMIGECQGETWERASEWTSACIHYMAKAYDLDVIFSHFHNVDLQGHMLVAFLKNGSEGKLPAETIQRLFKNVYAQTDRYIGTYFDMLDEGWDIIIVSDHGQTCPEYHISQLCSGPLVDAGWMMEKGYTVVKKDENGNDLPEIDWTKTKAIMWRSNQVYINVKGRDQHTLEDGTVIDGIVDPADKFDLEEEIITEMYKVVSPVTGHRVVALALHNKDAVLLGEGGPGEGDIIYYDAENYSTDHANQLSTSEGALGTSVKSIFLAAGPSFKENFYTERIIHHNDLVPTIASIMNTRVPEQCEGAPVYQILK